MAFSLLRASALQGSALRRAASAAPAVAAAAASGREGLATFRAVSLPSSPPRRLLHSTVPGDRSPKSPDEKLNALVDEILATKGASVPHDVVVGILLNAILARQESDANLLSRTYLTSGVLVFGGLVGYVLSRKHANDRAKHASDGARTGTDTCAAG